MLSDHLGTQGTGASTLSSLLSRLGDVISVEWADIPQSVLDVAQPVVVDLEYVGHQPARLLRREGRVLRLLPGTDGLYRYEVALVAVEGEDQPRWVASERIVPRARLAPIATVKRGI